MPMFAGVAHPVERHLAKVEVASSSLVTRSIKKTTLMCGLFLWHGRDSKIFYATCRWHVAATSSKTGGYHNFHSQGE